jgi:hypothetical protein
MFKTINGKFSALFGFGSTASGIGILLKKWVWKFSLVIMVSVFVPCSLESVAAETKKPAELVDGGYVSGESINKDVGGIGVGVSQGCQRVCKSGAKSCGSVSLPNLKVVTPSKISSDTSKGENSKEIFNGQFLLLFALVFCVFVPLYGSCMNNQNQNKPISNCN